MAFVLALAFTIRNEIRLEFTTVRYADDNWDITLNMLKIKINNSNYYCLWEEAAAAGL